MNNNTKIVKFEQKKDTGKTYFVEVKGKKYELNTDAYVVATAFEMLEEAENENDTKQIMMTFTVLKMLYGEEAFNQMVKDKAFVTFENYGEFARFSIDTITSALGQIKEDEETSKN